MNGPDPPWFAFIVHPRDLADARASGPGRFLDQFSANDEEFRRKVRTVDPFVTGEIRFGFAPIWGEVITLSRFPEEMLKLAAARAVAKAVDLAVRRGARVVGLGALTSPITQGGTRVVSRLPPGVTLTTGNAYTAAVVRRNVIEASTAIGLGREARVAVVGCTGSVGGATSRLLAEAGFELLLVGRTATRARRSLEDLAAIAHYSGDVAEAGRCDIVVVVTSDPRARLDPAALRPGSVLIDVGQPSCFTPDDRAEFRRRAINFAEGGIVRIPGYSSSHDLRLASSRDTFACLAETFLFARNGLRQHSLGLAATELALRLEKLAEKQRIVVRPLDIQWLPEVQPSQDRALQLRTDYDLSRTEEAALIRRLSSG